MRVQDQGCGNSEGRDRALSQNLSKRGVLEVEQLHLRQADGTDETRTSIPGVLSATHPIPSIVKNTNVVRTYPPTTTTNIHNKPQQRATSP